MTAYTQEMTEEFSRAQFHRRREILDHGYIEVVDVMGSEERIVEAARMSTQKGFEGWGPRFKCTKCGVHFAESQIDPVHVSGYKCFDGTEIHDWTRDQPGDEKLLRFLYENRHATPFEMAGLVIEVQAPIFVFREWHRHRVPFSYNEASARYAPLPNKSYLPTVERALANSKTNKQAGTVKDAAELTKEVACDLLKEEEDLLVMIEDLYQRKLAAGFPKELARTHLSVSRYSKMRASSNLRGWLNFLALRSDANPGAQWEIRQYGNALREILTESFPRTLALFAELGRAP